jgi:ribosomal protein L37AE/L43A
MSEEKESTPIEDVKCPWCGRKKTVRQLDERTYHCDYCQRMFDPEED